MIDVQELLRVKEDDLARVQREVEALRTVAVLLSESDDAEAAASDADHGAARVQFEGAVAQENASEDEPSPNTAEGLFQSKPAKRSRVRDWLGRAVSE